MKDKPVILTAVLGLLLWSAVSATTLTMSSIPSPSSNPLQDFMRWYSCLWPGMCPDSVGNKTNPAAVQTTTPWFLPSFIFLLSSASNMMWIVLAYTVLGVHRRIEIEQSVYFAAVLAFMPPLMPVLALFQQLFQPRRTSRGRLMEA